MPPISEAILWRTSIDGDSVEVHERRLPRMNQKFSQLDLFRRARNSDVSILWTFVQIGDFDIRSRCLSSERKSLALETLDRSQWNLPNLRDLLTSSTNDAANQIVGNGNLTLSLNGRTVRWKAIGHQRCCEWERKNLSTGETNSSLNQLPSLTSGHRYTRSKRTQWSEGVQLESTKSKG